MNDTKNGGKETLPIKKQANELVDGVLKRIQEFHNNGELHLPENYSAPNALRSAWLILQNVKDRNKQPALSVCTKASVANAMLDMIIQGLNPSKKHCSFVVYGNQLVMQREYQGSKALCRRVDSTLEDVYSEVIYEGDELEFSIERGVRTIIKHVQKFSNIDISKIVGAYAVAVGKDGKAKRTEIMTLKQIMAAWKMSKTKPVDEKGNLDPASTHAKFKDEMCKKTVINRLAKHIIGSSDDSGLVIDSARRTDDHAAAAEAQAEVDEFGNQEVIDIEHDAGDDPGPEEETPTDTLTDEEKAEIEGQEREEAAAAAGGPGF